jgi:hypothetical protein
MLTGRSGYKECRSIEEQNRNHAISLLFYLPRELRNRVYMFCVRGPYDDEVIVRRPTSAEEANVLLVRQPTSQCSYRWMEDPIHLILNIATLKDQVAKELLEAYYWTRTFKCSHRDLPFLGLFLNTDRYGFGMVPSSYIRRLQLQIEVDYGTHLKLPLAKEVVGKSNLHAIKGLAEVLTTRTEVCIDVIVPSDVQDDYDCPEILEESVLEIEKVVAGLRQGGFRISVTHNELWGHWGDGTGNLAPIRSHVAAVKTLEVGTV